MNEELSTPVDSQPTPTVPTSVSRTRGWRSIVQVPLLLLAAGGLGFAGQQIWQNPTDFQSYLSIPQRDVPCSSHLACASAAMATTSCSTATQTDDGCGASLLALSDAAELAVDATGDVPVSALQPENFRVVRSESF